MNIQGKILDYNGKRLIISAPFTDTELLSKQSIVDCEVILSDGRHITPSQRKYIYAMLRDIGFYSGHEADYLKDYFKADYISQTGESWFSLSNCSMTQANGLIEILIQFCIEWNIPTKDNLINFAPDISKYLYMCLKNKVCCVCRQKAELHHVDRVGMGRDRNEITQLGMRAMPLTRKYHNEAHTLGQAQFNAKYHVYGIALNEELCRIWKVRG